MKVEDFLDLETDLGVRVRDIHLLNGHYLVHKIRIVDQSTGEHGKAIALPELHTRRSVGNMSCIKGFIIRVSDPWRRQIPEYEEHWSEVLQRKRRVVKKMHRTDEPLESDVKPGDCVIYNSFAVAKVRVPALLDELAIIREIDIQAVFSIDDIDDVQVGELAMSQSNIL